MPTLQDLQRGKSRIASRANSTYLLNDEESIITDQRCELSPAQCVEEKLIRLLQGSENVLTSAFAPRRPR